MKYEYDPEVDVMFIKIRQGKPDYGEQAGNIITHFDKQHKLIEIEILDASKTLTKALKPTLVKA